MAKAKANSLEVARAKARYYAALAEDKQRRADSLRASARKGVSKPSIGFAHRDLYLLKEAQALSERIFKVKRLALIRKVAQG